MPSRGPRRLRRTGVATAVVAALLLDAALRSTVTAYSVSEAVGSLALVASAAVLVVGDSFEARLVTVLVSSLTALLVVLTAILGDPGGSGDDWGPRHVVLLAASLAVPLLLLWDVRSRGAHRPTSPYAP